MIVRLNPRPHSLSPSDYLHSVTGTVYPMNTILSLIFCMNLIGTRIENVVKRSSKIQRFFIEFENFILKRHISELLINFSSSIRASGITFLFSRHSLV